MSLQQIATERELTVETILSHLETIKVSHPHIDMSPYKPAQKDLKKILEAFAEVGDTKLSPVHKKLKGVYDFNTLRLARLFLD